MADRADRRGQRELASEFGVTTRQIRNLHDAGMPRNRDGTYPWPKCLQWYIEFKAEDKAKRAKPPEDEDLVRREQVAKVKTAEIKALRAAGQVVPTPLFRKRLRELAQQFAGVIRSLPQYAPELLGAEDLPAMTVRCERIANSMLLLAKGEEEPGIDDEAALDEDEITETEEGD